MGDGADSERVYHRLESPTQTPAGAARRQASGEIWRRPALWSLTPEVKAYRGPLPIEARGIEFVTDVLPDVGSARRRVDWSGPRPGVRVEGDIAKIEVVVTKHTQA